MLAALALMALLSVVTRQLLDGVQDAAEAQGRVTVERIARVAEVSIDRHFRQVDSVLAGLPSLIDQTAPTGGETPATASRLLHALPEQVVAASRVRESVRIIAIACAIAILLLALAFALDATLGQRERLQAKPARALRENAPEGGIVGIHADITELKRANRDLATANAAAAGSVQAQSRLMARMSHELRTPLNGLLGLAQALARDPLLTPAQREQAAAVEMAGRHLVAVANDVLDLSLVEAGPLELRPEPVALAGLLASCVTLMRPAVTAKRIALLTNLSAALPPMVAADSTRLRQVLFNLLANAVKFTPEGGQVLLRASLGAKAGLGGQVTLRIEVRDTGPGVPFNARQQIFEESFRPERRGGGLGLAIARHITESMGGHIGCEANAEAASGALFWLELPWQLAVTAPSPTCPMVFRPLRLLVVDDVAANQAVARALLETAGHVVECVGDGTQAVARFSQAVAAGQPYDAVLMDVMMPVMDGLEATRRIREQHGLSLRTPILAVTASDLVTDIAACHAAGMNDHVTKPIERDALLLALARLTAGNATDPAGTSQPSGLPLLSRRGGALSVQVPGLDFAAAQRLIPEFVQEIELALARLRVTSATGSTVAAQALAGAAATLGAARLADAARRLASACKAGQADQAATLHEETLAVAAATLEALASALPVTSVGMNHGR